MKTSPRKKNHAPGFSTLESLAFIAVLGGLGFVSFKEVNQLKERDIQAKRTHGLYQLEIAKTQFTQRATPEERTRFNQMSNEARFGLLTEYLSPSDPKTFSVDYHLKNIDIQDLTQPPTAE
jgi:hypothetical protein